MIPTCGCASAAPAANWSSTSFRVNGSRKRSLRFTRGCLTAAPNRGRGAPDVMSGRAALDWLSSFGWVIFIAAAVISFGLLVLLRPLLRRHALAHPNVRSSHKTPTPQGGGIAVIAATTGVVAVTMLFGVPGFGGHSVWLVLAATVFIALVGAIDDLRSIAVMPRLVLQMVGVAIVLASLPGDLRVVPIFPFWLERALLGLAILWFVNLTNFMDGIDWMTVAEVVPLSAGTGFIRLHGRAAARRHHRRAGALRRDDRLCAGQPPGRASVSRRRRAVCRLASCSAGCLSCSPATGTSRRRCCCRSIILPMRRSRCCAGS